MAHYLRDPSHTSAADMTEIPEHLQYKPYTVPNQYAGTGPRYLDERKKPPPPNFEVKPFHAKEGIWNVASRHLEPRAPKRQIEPPPQYHQGSEYVRHTEYVKSTGWSGVESRHLNTKDPVVSPRELVQRQKERDRRLNGWRSNPVGGLSLTFDEIRKRAKRLLQHQKDHLDVKPRTKTPSVIRDYVKFRTPPRHYTTSERYVEEGRRQRAASAEALRSGRWTPGGGCGGGKWNRKPTSPRSHSIVRENDIINEKRYEASERTVGKYHVPRVAKLSPSASLARWESDVRAASEAGPSAAGDSPAVASPHPTNPNPTGTRSPMRRSNSHVPAQGDGEGTVLVGPVTVAVPPGAIVRLSSTHRPPE